MNMYELQLESGEVCVGIRWFNLFSVLQKR